MAERSKPESLASMVQKDNPPLTVKSLHQQQTDPKDEQAGVNRFLEGLESEPAGFLHTPLNADITKTDDEAHDPNMLDPFEYHVDNLGDIGQVRNSNVPSLRPALPFEENASDNTSVGEYHQEPSLQVEP
ncbi:hypothetical protein BDV59DRAFT_205012 [Aspergillus ambiguus]|uniref:uncharacterized protein n=1 Tax=Aspergillus ambiguus TaxID=176160 RepID=UPI003CCDEF69